MAFDPLLDRVMVALRTTTDDSGLMQEIDDLIMAARADLRQFAGVTSEWTEELPERKALVRQAIILYVKYHWGYDNPDAERQEATYKTLRKDMAMYTGFGGVTS